MSPSPGTLRAEPPLHGGRVLAALRAFPGAPLPWIDLSTGVNPYAWPMPPIPPAAWTTLPEPETLRALEQTAAMAYGATPGWQVVAAPGTSILIATLARLRPGPAAIVGPTYGEYVEAWQGAAVVPDLPTAVRTAAMRIVCRPDNPTGTVHPRADLDAAAHGGTLIVDESYADFMPGSSLLPCADPAPGTVVLRSFGKAYGLPGLRLGFALTDGTMAEALRRALGPWPVSGPALLAGTAALADAAWRTATGRQLRSDRARFDAMLRAAGFADLRGTSLFTLARCTDAPGWADRLARRGILVRPFSDRPHSIRFGLPGADPAAWARVAEALTV